MDDNHRGATIRRFAPAFPGAVGGRYEGVMSVRELAIVLLAMLALPVAAAPLPGAVTGIAETPDGGATVTGWACRFPGTAAPRVRVSAGGPRSPGQSVAAVTADRPAPSGAGPCGSGTAQGFAAPLNHADLFRYGGLPVSVTISGQQLAGGRRLPAWRVVGDVPRTCTVRDLESLRSCFAQADVYDRFVFTADASCAGAACCKQPDLPAHGVVACAPQADRRERACPAAAPGRPIRLPGVIGIAVGRDRSGRTWLRRGCPGRSLRPRQQAVRAHAPRAVSRTMSG